MVTVYVHVLVGAPGMTPQRVKYKQAGAKHPLFPTKMGITKMGISSYTARQAHTTEFPNPDPQKEP